MYPECEWVYSVHYFVSLRWVFECDCVYVSLFSLFSLGLELPPLLDHLSPVPLNVGPISTLSHSLLVAGVSACWSVGGSQFLGLVGGLLVHIWWLLVKA